MEKKYTLKNRKHAEIAVFPSYEEADEACRAIIGSYIQFNQEAIKNTRCSTIKITVEKTFAPGLDYTMSTHPWSRAAANVRSNRSDGFVLRAGSQL